MLTDAVRPPGDVLLLRTAGVPDGVAGLLFGLLLDCAVAPRGVVLVPRGLACVVGAECLCVRQLP